MGGKYIFGWEGGSQNIYLSIKATKMSTLHVCVCVRDVCLVSDFMSMKQKARLPFLIVSVHKFDSLSM